MPRDSRMDASKGEFYNEKTGQKIELLAAAKNAPPHLREYVLEPKPAGVAAERSVPNATERALIDRVKARAAEKKGGKSRRRHKKRRGTRRHRRR